MDTQQKLSEIETNAILLTCDDICATNDEMHSTNWWIDNGTTKHVTNTLNYFTEFQEFKDEYNINTVGKETLKVLGQGTVRMVLNVNNKKEFIYLIDVWYVPGSSKNLFSGLSAHDRNKNSAFQSISTVLV